MLSEFADARVSVKVRGATGHHRAPSPTGQPASQPLTIFVLGLLFALTTFAAKGPVGWFAGRLSGGLRQRPQVLLRLYRGSGVILLGLGLRLAFERRD